MKKLLLSFTLLASTLGTSALALADDHADRDRVVDHRDDRGDRNDRNDRDERQVRLPSWSAVSHSKLATKKGSVTIQMNRASGDDDRLRLAISGGSAQIKKVTISYVGGGRSVLAIDQLLSGSATAALAMPARHGDIKSVTITYAKARGRQVSISLEGIDRPSRDDAPSNGHGRRGGK